MCICIHNLIKCCKHKFVDVCTSSKHFINNCCHNLTCNLECFFYITVDFNKMINKYFVCFNYISDDTCSKLMSIKLNSYQCINNKVVYFFRNAKKFCVKYFKFFLYVCYCPINNNTCYSYNFRNYNCVDVFHCFTECRIKHKNVYVNTCLFCNCPEVFKMCIKVIFKFKYCCYKTFYSICRMVIKNSLNFSKCFNCCKKFLNHFCLKFICYTKKTCFDFSNCKFNTDDCIVNCTTCNTNISILFSIIICIFICFIIVFCYVSQND